jgi:hypothetical protein
MLHPSHDATAGRDLSTVVDTRPARAEIEPAALDVIRRRGAEILLTKARLAPQPRRDQGTATFAWG